MSNFTPDEVRTMFTLWGIFRSPLFLGGDLPEMPADVLAMLTNGDYLQMHATSYGARELLRRETNGRGTIQWVACGRGCKYAAMFNTQDRPARQTLDLTAPAPAGYPLRPDGDLVRRAVGYLQKPFLRHRPRPRCPPASHNGRMMV